MAISSSPIYAAYRYMLRRVRDARPENAQKYWVGVKVCTRWKNPNSAFVRNNHEGLNCFILDMTSSWFPGAFLDREDSTQGYSPENCRWVTPAESIRDFKNYRRVSP